MNFSAIIRLVRANQWYKNIVIFLPLIFGAKLFNLFSFKQTIAGFIAFCMVSSSNYIINDIIDRKKDKNNPEKRFRPIAAGEISVDLALIAAVFLLIAGLYLSYNLSLAFFMLAALSFILIQAYTLWLKNEPFIDILVIPTNFVIRTVSGAFVIADGFSPYIRISPWLILGPFFLALFLAISKRRSEIFLLKDNFKSHRNVLEYYDDNITWALLIISIAILISCYSLYTFFSPYPLLIWTIPFFLYMIFRMFYLVKQNSPLARYPELAYKDYRILISMIIFSLILLGSIYLK